MRNFHMLSGGKDSTAQVLMAVERGEPIEQIVFFDTGWEFPEMYRHLRNLEKFIGLKITRLTPARPFHYWLTERPIIARKGPLRGMVHRIGNGWPSKMRRWCTREKTRALDYYMRGQSYVGAEGKMVKCIGYAADEPNREDPAENYGWEVRYPLREWDITEIYALEYCYSRGFDWGGLYEQMRRVSCFCCPLQPTESLAALRKYHPDLFETMLRWEAEIPKGSNRRFYGNKTLSEIEHKLIAHYNKSIEPTTNSVAAHA